MIDSVGLGDWSCQRRRKKSREEGGFVVDIFVVGRGRGWSWRVELKFGEATRQTAGLFICMGNGNRTTGSVIWSRQQYALAGSY